jgi:hypothetical protein
MKRVREVIALYLKEEPEAGTLELVGIQQVSV